jgi:hypothetical protein
MTFPIYNTKELFNYIANLPGVSIYKPFRKEPSDEIVEFRLNDKPWIYAVGTDNMDSIGHLFKLADNNSKTNYPINILFSSDKIFFKDLNTSKVPIFSIDHFTEWLFREHPGLQPAEYLVYSQLKTMQYSFDTLLSDTLRLKNENAQLKKELQDRNSQLYDAQSKLKDSQDKEKNKADEIKKLKKMNSDLANYTIQNNKLLSEKQVSSIVKFYKENVAKFSNPSEFTISFYKSNKLIRGTYNEYYTAWIEGAGIDQRSHKDSCVYFDEKGEQLLSIETTDEKLFDIEWDVFVSIYKIALT